MGNSCFIDHECDAQKLFTSTKPVLECKSYPITSKDGKSATVTEMPMLTPEALWRTYQQEAIDIIAPGGSLISNPIARNQAINSAYAALWLSDNRFQWAGLAAFASKQVGCGLVSAKKKMEQIGLSFPWPPFTEDNLHNITGLSAWKMYETLAWGNMLLFLDIYPLHAFYKKRGIDELKQCLQSRQNLSSAPVVSKYWTAEAQDKVPFGQNRKEILDGFQAIADGNIVESVKHLARHEQINILQPLIYEDSIFVTLLRGNQATSDTGAVGETLGSEELQLTLASDCQVADQRKIQFSSDPMANLADVDQRMEFVLRAATKFDELLHNAETRPILETSLREIKAGQSFLP